MTTRGTRDGKVRIIAGTWRGRRLAVPGGSVRPTPDRVRETLFNWLGPGLIGADCLDLFAGTGVLGFEALSRGACSVLFVEQDRELVAHLESESRRLGASGASVRHADAAAVLDQPNQYDVIFLDPPYSMPVEELLDRALDRLTSDGTVYVERAATEGLPVHPNVDWHRRKRAGNVEFGLARPVARQ